MKKIIGIMITLFGIYSMVFYAAGTNEWVNKAFCIFALVSMCFLLLTKSFKEKFPKIIKEPIVIGAFSYFIIYLISSFYAKVGKIAFDELTKLLIAIAIFIITMIIVNRDNMRFTLKFLAGAIGILGLLNIDLAGVKILSYPFLYIVKKIVPGIQAYGNFLSSRIWTAFGNPNVFAPVMAVGVLLSIYLYMSSENRKEKVFSAIVLTFSWIAFILCVSLGATLVFGISLIVFVAFMEKENRIKTFLTILVSGVVSICFTVIIFTILKTNKLVYLADLFMIVAGIVNWLVLIGLDKIIVKIGSKAEKTMKIIGLSVMGILVLYIILSLNVTSSYNQETFVARRAFYPKAGEYTLKVDVDKPIYVSISSQNMEQAQNYSSKNIINKKIDKNSNEKFIVGEDVKVMYVTLSGDKATLNSVKIIDSNGKTKNITLKYSLVPEFLVNRLVGLRANQSMLQRFVFWEDGLKLFAKSPIIGNGVGAFETEINSVRNMNYETRYTHNILVTVALEMGIMGLLIFVGFIVVIYYTLLKRETEYLQLKATMLAIFTMILIHSCIEVDMNYATILILLFIILAIIVTVFNKQQNSYKTIKAWKVGLPIAIISIVFVIMLIGNLEGQNYLLKKEKGGEIFSKLKQCMILDPYNRADYMLSYVSHAKANENNEDARKYLDKLKNSYSYASCEYIEKYYIESFDLDTVFKLSKMKLQKNRANQDIWREEFQYYETLMSRGYIKKGGFENRYEEILDMILSNYNELIEANKGMYKKIELHERNINLVARALKAKALFTDYDVEDSMDIMDNFVYDSNIMVDANSDGANENYKISKDNKSMTFNVFIKAPTLSRFRGEIDAGNISDITGITVGGTPKEITVEGDKVIFEIFTQGEGNTGIKINSNNASSIKRVVMNKDKL